MPPGLQPACGACISGWASIGVNSSYCSLCSPGTYAPGMRSPECSQCPAGTYASSWGSQHCKHCILGALLTWLCAWQLACMNLVDGSSPNVAPSIVGLRGPACFVLWRG